MIAISLEAIQEAEKRIAPYIRKTPLLAFDYLSKTTGKEILLKCESLQRTGSFKIRGAANCILSQMDQAKKRGVVAASAGNHAQGVATIAHLLGIECTIVMPTVTPTIKVHNTQRAGAKVVLHGEYYDQSFEYAKTLSDQKGYLLIHPFRDPLVIAGQGTIGLELAADPQFKDCEAVVVSVGGGGLSCGVAAALKALRPEIKVYGAAARHAPSAWKSFHLGSVMEESVLHTIAEGVATKCPDKNMLETMRQSLHDCHALGEESIALAISLISEHAKMIVEGAGAIPIASVLEGLIPEKKICLVLSGGNIDLPTLGQVLDWGLAAQGRLIRLEVTITDRPGGLSALTQVLARVGANIVQVFHQRSDPRHRFGEAQVELTLETRDREHSEEIKTQLRQEGYQVNALS